MKNKIFFTIIGCCLMLHDLCAQNAQKNLEKYWIYRERLNQFFTMVGPDPGQSMIADARNNYQGMRFGEEPVYHGYYMGVLATEFALLQRNGQYIAAEHTLTELYYAIIAIDRLDLMGEFFYNLPPSLNGIAIRDDVDKNLFLSGSYNDHFNNSPTISPSPSKGKVAKDDGCISMFTSVKYGSGVPDKDGGSVWSQDLISQLYIGLALIKKFVPNSISFEDKITLQMRSFSFSQKAVEISNRLIYYMQMNNWRLIQPNLVKISAGYGGFAQFTSPGFCYAHKYMDSNFNPIAHMFPGTLPYWKAANIPYNSHGIYCVLAAVGDSWDLRKRSTDEVLESKGSLTWNGFNNGGAEFYRLLHQDLYDMYADSELLCRASNILNSAPEFGPWAYSATDIAPNGWAATRRFYDNPEVAVEGGAKHGKDSDGNHNGLDYMLLHNLLYLNPKILTTQGTLFFSGTFPQSAAYLFNGSIAHPEIRKTNQGVIINDLTVGTIANGLNGHVEVYGGSTGVFVTNTMTVPNSNAQLIIGVNNGGCDVDVSKFKWPDSYNPSYR